MPQKFSSQKLTSGWSFKAADEETEESWLPVAKVPSTVQQDLLDNKKLKDPFIGFNEIKAEWVGSKSWLYRRKLQRPKDCGQKSKVVIAFDGLDTFADVKIDGRTILKSDSMFQPHRVDVTSALNDASEHNLEIEFSPALLKAREIEKQHPEHKWRCFNGETARLAVRKAQYHWGWDWGPILMCAGIWKEARLEVYDARISDTWSETEIASDQKSAKLLAHADVESENMDGLAAKFTISLDGKDLVSATGNLGGDGKASAELRLDNPSLWFPAGYGSQTLYTVTTQIFAGDAELDRVSKTIGIRKVELIQTPDSHGKSFYFRINGVDIYCGGSCWIPTDSILTNVTPEKYRAWIELLVPANQKMIRVWGGGIYEDDAFYDACDSLGILVWQDFMFGCGNYPCFPSILDSIKVEADAQLRRLRHHPCFAIFAGNNEDYQVQEQAGLKYNYEDKDPNSWLKTDFPARYIYEKILPESMAALLPSVPYHPGSPWGDGKISSDPTVGDMHQWNVWHGTQEKYQIFDSLGGRFNSEFGMEAFPHLATIETFIEDQKDLYPQSHVLDFHNKADGHERRIATYLVENVRTNPDLRTYIHLTQLIQCEALMFGYRGWRKQWGQDRHCGGALVWQLNDCWPTTSWSIVDYYLRRKPSYYAMARTLAPLAVGVRREHHDWSVSHARAPKTQKYELWAVSSHLDKVEVDVELRFISVESGKEIKPAIRHNKVALTPNGTTEIASGSIDNIAEEPHVLAARMWLSSSNSDPTKVVARDMDWPQPLKYLPFPARGLKVEVKGDKMHVKVDRPVKCLVFEERQGCHLTDSAIDVAPGDEQVVGVRGLKGGDQPLSWMYLGIGEQ
ncbi:MAG: hypothetical protein Q9227_006918 [Pyrenula ochraceoflavens]